MEVLSSDDALQRFETIWEYVECGISIVDAETREILDINPVAARMFGDAKEKIIGKRCHKFICPAEENSCPIMDKGMTVDRSERKFVRSDGEAIPIIKSVAKITYNGRLALLESFTDISNLKEAEEKLLQMQVSEQATRAKSDFLSRMSHEIRTPLNAIIGMTRIADSTDDVEKLKYCLSTIAVSSTYLLGLINDVLDMSKIEAGKLELDRSNFDIERMLMKICNLIVEKTEAKNIAFNVLLGGVVGATFVGDELRLSQVVANLLSNAVKFTPDGGRITLSVDETARSEGRSELRIVVSDTGIGMTNEQKDKLFNAFEQANASIARDFGGTGLGLAISKNIVEKMNGLVSVESEPGRGSSFIVEVALERAADGEAQTASEGPDARGARVLVVDAADEVGEAFRRMADLWGLRLDVSIDGEMALSLAEAAHVSGEPYSAIFIDCELPDMSGVEAARLLANRVDTGRIVMMTPFLRWNKIDCDARAVGVARFVPKPLFPSVVRDALLDAVSGRAEDLDEASSKERELPDFSNITLLLVEDVEINREIFSALLEVTNVRIDFAENGLDALEMFRENPERYDIIVMDVQMPVMDGYDATRAIRALDHPRAKELPIIAMTANAFRSDVEKCLEAGMNDHLPKPIDENAVIEKIAKYCPDKIL